MDDVGDIKGVGVYFLMCQEDDGTDSVYIGEAENVLDRLSQHLRDYQSVKKSTTGIRQLSLLVET